MGRGMGWGLAAVFMAAGALGGTGISTPANGGRAGLLPEQQDGTHPAAAATGRRTEAPMRAGRKGEAARRVVRPPLTRANPDGTLTAFLPARHCGLTRGGRDGTGLESVWFGSWDPFCSTEPFSYYGFVGEVAGLGECRMFATFDIATFPADAVVSEVRSLIDVWRYDYSPGDLDFEYCQMDGIAGLDACAAVYSDPEDASWSAACHLADPGLGFPATRVETTLGAAAAADFQSAVQGTGSYWSWGTRWTGDFDVAYGANAGQGGPSDPVLAITYTSVSSHSPLIASVLVSGSPVANIGPDGFDLQVTFTDVDGQPAGAFTATAFARSDAGREWSLGRADTVVYLGGSSYRATWTEVDLRDTIETGLYDVEARVNDGQTTAVSPFEDNLEALEVASPAFFTDDWDDFVPPEPTPTPEPAPPGWTVATSAGYPWTFYYSWDGGPDRVALADSGYIRPEPPASTVTSLVSDPIDCSAASDVHLNFYSEFDLAGSGGSGFGYVDYSTDGGLSWQTPVKTFYTAESGDYDFALPGAAGLTGVRIRFQLYADPAEASWLIDVVQLWDAPPGPQPAPGGIAVAPASVETLADETATFSGGFTDADSLTGDFRVTLTIRSPENLVWILADYAASGEQGIAIAGGGGSFVWSLAGFDFPPGPAPGAYDLEVTIDDGWTRNTDPFDLNGSELALTADTALLGGGYFNYGGGPPPGWSVVAGLGHTASDGWLFDLAWTGSTDHTASAWYDADPGEEQSDTYLLSPVFDCSGATGVALYYDTQWATGWDFSASTRGEVQFSTNGGATWDWLVRYQGEYLGRSVVYEDTAWIDISGLLAGQTNCRLRFWYYGYNDYYWLLDSVVVHPLGPPPPVPAAGPAGLALAAVLLGALLAHAMRRGRRPPGR